MDNYGIFRFPVSWTAQDNGEPPTSKIPVLQNGTKHTHPLYGAGRDSREKPAEDDGLPDSHVEK